MLPSPTNGALAVASFIRWWSGVVDESVTRDADVDEDMLGADSWKGPGMEQNWSNHGPGGDETLNCHTAGSTRGEHLFGSGK